MTDLVPVFHDEVQLMSWGESDTQGPWIKVRLLNSEALAPFRGMTKTKGDKAGQRLAVSMVEINDDETPKQEAPKGAALAKLAGMWCKDVEFQAWLADAFPTGWAEGGSLDSDEDRARAIVCFHCQVGSRADLDHKPSARALFDDLFRLPYGQYLKENG